MFVLWRAFDFCLTVLSPLLVDLMCFWLCSRSSFHCYSEVDFMLSRSGTRSASANQPAPASIVYLGCVCVCNGRRRNAIYCMETQSHVLFTTVVSLFSIFSVL